MPRREKLPDLRRVDRATQEIRRIRLEQVARMLGISLSRARVYLRLAVREDERERRAERKKQKHKKMMQAH